MDIAYDNKEVEQQCTDLKRAKKDFSDKVAKKIQMKIGFIESAESLQDVINYRPLRFHQLTGQLSGLYAMDVNGKRDQYRFIVKFDNVSHEKIFSDAKSIKIIQITEVSKHYE